MVVKIEKVKYLIFGGGFIGNKFKEYLGESVLSKKWINSVEDVKEKIEKYNPEFVINCVGATGRPNVDWCETHKEETMFSNILVPAMIAHACSTLTRKMVHIGTGCIYEGDNGGKGFSEYDEPNFTGSYYSRTKLIIEKILNDFNVLQLRIRMPLTGEVTERNLITKLLNYKDVLNTQNSLTYVDDLLRVAKELMDRGETGIFNIVNPEPETHKQLLDFYNEISPVKKEFKILSPEELDKETLARRSNCVLSIKKLEKLGIMMTDTETALRKCITQYVEEQSKK